MGDPEEGPRGPPGEAEWYGAGCGRVQGVGFRV